MPGKKARKRAPPNPSRGPAELEVECVTQLRKIGDKLNSLVIGRDLAAVFAEMPGKKGRRSEQRNPASAPEKKKERKKMELEEECVTQLRRFGDKLNFRQKLLNLISKLFNLIT